MFGVPGPWGAKFRDLGVGVWGGHVCYSLPRTLNIGPILVCQVLGGTSRRRTACPTRSIVTEQPGPFNVFMRQSNLDECFSVALLAGGAQLRRGASTFTVSRHQMWLRCVRVAIYIGRGFRAPYYDALRARQRGLFRILLYVT